MGGHSLGLPGATGPGLRARRLRRSKWVRWDQSCPDPGVRKSSSLCHRVAGGGEHSFSRSGSQGRAGCQRHSALAPEAPGWLNRASVLAQSPTGHAAGPKGISPSVADGPGPTFLGDGRLCPAHAWDVDLLRGAGSHRLPLPGPYAGGLAVVSGCGKSLAAKSGGKSLLGLARAAFRAAQ